MEFIGNKRGRKRKRKRPYKRRSLNNKYKQRDQIEIQVNRSTKCQKLIFESNNCNRKEKSNFKVMEANAFWENYKAAHKWQKRHDITWWKTRCFALEHENYLLKEALQNLVQNKHDSICNTAEITENENYFCAENANYNNEEEDNNGDGLEFQLNEDMMNFLAQSMRHKIELKNKKESEKVSVEEKTCDDLGESRLALVQKRNEEARLLYGEACSKILAMETALQATMERHLDKTKPQYWPNIPLKL